jgi:hypothetical protein
MAYQLEKRKFSAHEAFQLVIDKKIKLSIEEAQSYSREVCNLFYECAECRILTMPDDILEGIFLFLTQERTPKNIPVVPLICKKFASIYKAMENTRFRLFVSMNDRFVRAAILLNLLDSPKHERLLTAFSRKTSDQTYRYLVVISKKQGGRFQYAHRCFRNENSGPQNFFTDIMGEPFFIGSEEDSSSTEIFWLLANLLKNEYVENVPVSHGRYGYWNVTYRLISVPDEESEGLPSIEFLGPEEPKPTAFSGIVPRHPISWDVVCDEVKMGITISPWLDQDIWDEFPDVETYMKVCKKWMPKSFFF